MHVRIVFSLPELGDFKRRVLLVLSVRTRLLNQKKEYENTREEGQTILCMFSLRIKLFGLHVSLLHFPFLEKGTGQACTHAYRNGDLLLSPRGFHPIVLAEGDTAALLLRAGFGQTPRGWGRREENGRGAGRTSTHKEK